MSINKRKFKRNQMKGIMTCIQCLKHLYAYGPKDAIKPNHATIETLVKSNYVTRDSSLLTITEIGKQVVAERFPSLGEFQGVEEE